MRIQFLSLLIILLSGCKEKTDSGEIEVRDFVIEKITVDEPPPPPPPPPPPKVLTKKKFKGAGLIREGKHQLTLQWISWDRPGTVIIKQVGDSLYSVKGKQENPKNKDYVSVNGLFKALSKNELLFEGTVTMQVETVNGGKPCIKNGPMTFLAKDSRQYWRMQDMINCEGNYVTDYVDVYFK